MCLTIVVHRTPLGFVQERPLPARPVPTKPKPTIETSKIALNAAHQAPNDSSISANEKSYSDPPGGLSLPSLSPPDKNGRSVNHTAGHKNTTSVKQQTPNKRERTTPKEQINKEHSKQVRPTPKQTKPVPLPTDIPATAPLQRVPQTLKKAVSFSDTLTRGRGRSYTPPVTDKAVRFAPGLTCGEGSGYSELSPKRSEVFPFTTAETAEQQPEEGNQRVSQTSNKKSNAVKRPQSIEMDVKNPFELQDKQMDFDMASDSDDSFTDLPYPIASAKGNAPSHQDLKSGHHRYFGSPSPPDRFSTLMRRDLSTRQNGLYSDVRGDESHIGAVTQENTRRNSLSEVPILNNNRRTRKGTASAPVFNYGQKFGTKPADFSVFGRSTHHGWPQPVFVWRGKNPPAIPGRQSPVFVLRRSSVAEEPITTTSTKERVKQQHQPPSINDGGVDAAIYTNQDSMMTCRDV
ncbi:MAG: hypothetical protein Q9219_004599 [cf. Caloplaca sp. 3 TL-2023]